MNMPLAVSEEPVTVNHVELSGDSSKDTVQLSKVPATKNVPIRWIPSLKTISLAVPLAEVVWAENRL